MVLGFDPENVIDVRDATQAETWSTFGSRESAERSDLWSYLDPGGGSDVVVFYSGHSTPGLGDGRGYLPPTDANPNTQAHRRRPARHGRLPCRQDAVD